MATLATTVDGLKLPNPFIIGSGPPGTNLNVITRAFREGWGAVIAKTISLEADKVVNVTPRYAKLLAADGKDVVGWENIELISDRPFNIWLDEFKKCKDQFPDRVLIASIMEEYNRDAWAEIVERCEDTGVDAFELNFSCPHGLPERKMGAAMGENPEILQEVAGWVMAAAKKPVWAKMTPNVTRIEDPSRAAFRAGCQGVSAINTIRSVMAVNLETLREFPGRSLSAIGGIETGGDAAQFILLGADTTQVCTGVMKHGYERVKRQQEELLAFMEKHNFETLADFKGKSLDYFTTHAELVRMQKERKARDKAAAEAAAAKKMVKADSEWSGDEFVKQSDALARG